MCVSAAAAAVRVSPSTARRRRPSPSSLCVARGGAFGSRAALPRDFFGLSARGVLWARGGAPFWSRRAVQSEIRMAAVCGEAGELDGAEDPRPAAPPPWLCRAGYARHVSGRVGVKNFRSDEIANGMEVAGRTDRFSAARWVHVRPSGTGRGETC